MKKKKTRRRAIFPEFIKKILSIISKKYSFWREKKEKAPQSDFFRFYKRKCYFERKKSGISAEIIKFFFFEEKKKEKKRRRPKKVARFSKCSSRIKKYFQLRDYPCWCLKEYIWSMLHLQLRLSTKTPVSACPTRMPTCLRW